MRGWRATRLWATLCGVALSALLLSACDPELLFTPVPPTETLFIMPASPTIAPRLPTLPEGEAVDDALATQVAAFQPRVPTLVPNTAFTVTPLPPPTQVFISLPFAMPDGALLGSLLFGAPRRPAPAVLLLHDADATKEAWLQVARTLQASGLNAIALDLRGFGESSGTPSWTRSVQDVIAVLERLRSLPNLDPNRLYVLGIGAGANIAFSSCASASFCRAAALISPLPVLEGVPLEAASAAYGARRLLIAYGREDARSAAAVTSLAANLAGERRILPYEGAARGMILLESQPNLIEIIARWLLE
ncbi:MAG: alpha/beta fold hydrolase [Chloroflexota bacterium]|nr:MAG: alpha/beta fold hydrolase [Chloroflexota bacterium]